MKSVIVELDAHTHEALKKRAARNRQPIPRQLVSEALHYAAALPPLSEKGSPAPEKDSLADSSAFYRQGSRPFAY